MIIEHLHLSNILHNETFYPSLALVLNAKDIITMKRKIRRTTTM